MNTEPTKVLRRMAESERTDRVEPADVEPAEEPSAVATTREVPEATASEARPERRRRRWVWLPWALVVLTTGAAVFSYLGWQGAESAEVRRDEVRAVAQDFLVALTNFDAATIEQDAEELRAFAVGQFADEVDQYFGPAAIEDIVAAEATSVGEVQSLFVQDVEGETASAFGAVHQTVTNNTLEQPRVEIVRIEIGMIETSSGWKINRVDILQIPVVPEPTG